MKNIKKYTYPKKSGFYDYEGVPTLFIDEAEKVVSGINKKKNELSLNIPIHPLMGHMTWIELSLVIGIIKSSEARSFLEIGTLDGLIVENILNNCLKIENVITIDLPESIHKHKGSGSKLFIDSINAEMINTFVIGERFLNNSRRNIVTQIRKDSAKLKLTDFKNKFDVILVDGSHTYDYCASDTELAKKLLSKKGIIIWHDFNKVKALVGVTEFLSEEARKKEFSLYWLKDREYNSSSVVVGLRKSDFQS